MSTDEDAREDGWDEPDEDEVTDPDDLAEADPDMEQSPLRVEEQPEDDVTAAARQSAQRAVRT